MRQVKAVFLALVAVLVVGAAGAGSAHTAGFGWITTAPNMCAFSVSNGSWVPEASGDPYYEAGSDNGYKVQITSVTPGTPCDFKDFQIPVGCEVWIHKSKQNHSVAAKRNKATLTGCFYTETTLPIIVPVDIECTYQAASPGLTGAWAWVNPPTNTKKSFNLTGDFVKIAPSDSLCPSTVSIGNFTVTVSYP